MSAPILISNLTKRYSKSSVYALESLSLTVGKGECYGFLGANGAGKSTTIRLLLDFLRPTSGSATIMGFDTARQGVSARKNLGYLAGDIALYDKPTGKELLDHLCDLQGLTDRRYRKVLEARFKADLNKPISSLSKGNKQKIGIIQAFMHKPGVLILDEPTSGLDPLMQEAFYETVQENKARGAAIFMSSHNFTEAQRVCDRVGIIKQGKLVHEQTIEDNDMLTRPTFNIAFHKTIPAKILKEESLKVIKKIGTSTLIAQPSGDISKALAALGNYDIKEFSSQKVDLEDEFLEFYGDKS